MHFTSPLLRGTLLRRYKRFFADILLDSGEEIVAHCPNTGAMTGCALPNSTVYVSPANNPKRKLKFTWELTQTPQQHWIGVNTHHANTLVAEAIEEQRHPIFEGIQAFKREVTPPNGHSRFDFLLTQASGNPLFLEVKSVTLAQGNNGFFPDAVTQRGKKHALELKQLAEQKIATCLFFCVQHTGIESVRLAEHIDAEYANTVRDAVAQGVKVIAMGCEINQEKIVLNHRLNVIL